MEKGERRKRDERMEGRDEAEKEVKEQGQREDKEIKRWK